MDNGNIDTSNIYFNNLINQQVSQSSFDNSNGKKQTLKQNESVYTPQSSENSNSILNSLSDLLENAQNRPSETEPGADVIHTVYKLIQSGANPDSIVNLLDALTSDNGDIIYTRTGSEDKDINAFNKMALVGGDLENFLIQSARVSQNNQDINKYLETVTNIVNNCDYDDLRRFIDVTDVALYENQGLSGLFDYVNNVARHEPGNIEGNLFTIQSLQGNGANLENTLKIMNNMDTSGNEGKQNMGELQAIIRDAKNRDCFMPPIFKEMADCGDTVGFMEAWLSFNGMKYVPSVDYTKHQRIESMDKKNDLVMHQGDDTAIFAQAVSSSDGILPESVLYWSSLQNGPLANGTSYLDLSKLEVGTYDIYVKIGNYEGGTDTAKRRVVVQAKNDNSVECKAYTAEDKTEHKQRHYMDAEKLANLNDFFGTVEADRKIREMVDNNFDITGFISTLKENGQDDLAKIIESYPQQFLDFLISLLEENTKHQEQLDKFHEVVKKEIIEKYLVNKEKKQEEAQQEIRETEDRQKENGRFNLKS